MAYTMLDGLGSVRGLTDQAGSVVWAASYDAFGVPRYASGAARTTLGYTGARTGAADGTVHLRARQLSPSLGRFLQRDSVAGLPARPQSLNRYAYTENNATTATDPSGHQSRPYTPPSNPYPYVRNSVAGGCRPAGVEDEIRALQRRLDELRRERGLFDKIFLGDFEDEALDIQLKINALQGGRQQLEQRLYDTLNSPDVMALRVFANPTSRVLIGGDLETWQAVPWGQRVLEGGLAAAFYGASLYRGGQAFREVGRLRKAEEELAGRRVLSWRGESTVITASSEITAFRVYGGEARQAGKWVTLGRPASARAALEASALPPGNTAQFVSEYRIPAGTRLRIGVTHEAYGAPGGGLQIRLLDRIPGSAIEPGVELPLGSLSSR
jgi:RHS repeat-associated protein